MQDLLKEEDFISKKIYNPWKHFLMFYIIAAVEVISFCFFAKNAKLEDEIIIGIALIGYFLSPIAMGFIMFFSKKENVLIAKKTIFLSQFILMMVYLIVFFLATIYINHTNYNNREDILMMSVILAIHIVYFIITSLLITIIVKVKHKRLSKE